MITKYRFDFKREGQYKHLHKCLKRGFKVYKNPNKQTNTQTKKQTTFLKNMKTYNMALRNTDRK